MFKKVLLSTLASVFLTMLIFTYATAFAVPNTAPPSGLANPTFGGLTVNGAAGFNNGLTVSSGMLNVKGGIVNDATSADATAVSVNDNFNVTGISNLGTTNIGTSTVNRNLTLYGGATVNWITVGAVENNTNLSVTGVSSLGSTTIGTTTAPKILTVNGNIKASKFGHTYQTSLASWGSAISDAALLGPSTDVYGGHKSDSAVCPTGHVVSCGFQALAVTYVIKCGDPTDPSCYTRDLYPPKDVNTVNVYSNEGLTQCWASARNLNPEYANATLESFNRAILAVAICNDPATAFTNQW